jgi:hypothetical protein
MYTVKRRMGNGIMNAAAKIQKLHMMCWKIRSNPLNEDTPLVAPYHVREFKVVVPR